MKNFAKYLTATAFVFASANFVPSVAVADQTANNKALAIEALSKTLGKVDADNVDKYFTPQYIQHNPDVPDGSAALKGLIGHLAQSGKFKATTIRVLAEGNMVAFHNRYVGFGPEPMIAFDVFRVENGRIAEHWDNLIAEQAPNPSGRSQIDGATEITDRGKTAANKAKAEEFITKILINHEQVDVTQFISPSTYLQHNPRVADGLAGFGAFMKDLASKGIEMEYSKLHFSIAEGNFVLTASEGAFGGKPMSFYDLFRLEDGLIVEHWDVIADMPGPDAKHNEAGKF